MVKLKKKRISKKEKNELQEKEMKKFLARMGYKGSNKGESIHEIPCYKVPVSHRTSDKVPDNGAKIKQSKYTGNEILGIAQMSKSNAVPIRKDNKKEAIEIARMRRG